MTPGTEDALRAPSATTVMFSPGEHISRAAQQMVAAAAEHGEADGTFNDIVLVATKVSTPQQVEEFYHQASSARAEAWRQSPEGVAYAQRNAEEMAEAQQTHDTLTAALPTLNMQDDVAILDWLLLLQPASDRVGVDKAANDVAILNHFAAFGYLPGMNCGADFVGSNRANHLGWIVGNALDGIQKIGAIHGIIHKFASEWKQQFGVALKSVPADKEKA